MLTIETWGFALGLDYMKRVGEKRDLRDLQESSSATNRKVPGTVAKVFEFATKLVIQEACRCRSVC